MLDTIVIEEKKNVKNIAGLHKGELREFVSFNSAKANEGDIFFGKITKKIATANSKTGYFVNIGNQNVFINAQEKELEDLNANEGQDIILQITQEARAEKDARASRFLQFSGNLLVFCPYGEQLDVSSKIRDEKKRKELYNLMEENTSEGGWIVRTSAEFCDNADIISEIETLQKMFTDILDMAKKISAPAELWKKDTCIEDILTRNAKSITKVVVNNHLIEKSLQEKYDVEYTTKPFETYGIAEQLFSAIQKEVKLKSGGRIFIEETKALVAIDVDSSTMSQQGNLNQLNNEAAAEIAKQIILRNLSGKIIIDFAGFADWQFLQNPVDILRDNLRYDAAKSRVLGITKAGNVEILRSRRRPPLVEYLTTECTTCQGTGRVENALSDL